MASNTLDDRDRAMLERLDRGAVDAEALADAAGVSAERARERLRGLADNGLVERVGDEYALSDDGERVVAASPAGTRDNRIDTPDDVEAAIESFDLRPDREAAVRNAFAFLRYWGEASGREVVDAVYSEDPAGYDDPDDWWADLVRDRLADLPSVDAPDSPDGTWRYEGTPTVDQPTDDGRLLLGQEGTDHSSTKYALEQLQVADDEREAVRAAFDLLAREREATPAAFRERVYPEHDAGFESADEWWGFVRGRLASLPGVEEPADHGEAASDVDATSDGEAAADGDVAVWRYRGTDDTGE